MVADHQGGGNQRGVTHSPLRCTEEVWVRTSTSRVCQGPVTAGLGNCGGTQLRAGARAGRRGRSKFLWRTLCRSSAFAAGQIKFHTTPDGT